MLFGMFGLQMVKNKQGLNMIALFAFTFASGIIITPLLTHIVITSYSIHYTKLYDQRLSHPNVATRRCPWQDNRCTSGSSNPVLSY